MKTPFRTSSSIGRKMKKEMVELLHNCNLLEIRKSLIWPLLSQYMIKGRQFIRICGQIIHNSSIKISQKQLTNGSNNTNKYIFKNTLTQPGLAANNSYLQTNVPNKGFIVSSKMFYISDNVSRNDDIRKIILFRVNKPLCLKFRIMILINVYLFQR